MNRPVRYHTTGDSLAVILEIARQQRECFARGDLDMVLTLQARRQQLMEGIQSIDKSDPDAHATLSEIMSLDQDMHCLLSSEMHEIKDKIKTIGSLRRLLQSRSPAGRRPPRHFSRHA